VNMHQSENYIRVLIADDDEHILACYREAFEENEQTDHLQAVDALAAELFDLESLSLMSGCRRASMAWRQAVRFGSWIRRLK
jgi:hypothetical protein